MNSRVWANVESNVEMVEAESRQALLGRLRAIGEEAEIGHFQIGWDAAGETWWAVAWVSRALNALPEPERPGRKVW